MAGGDQLGGERGAADLAVAPRQPLALAAACGRCFLLGGSAGNGIDRWLHGAVVDGLELVPFSFPVFNLADVAINLAVLCLLLDGLRSQR